LEPGRGFCDRWFVTVAVDRACEIGGKTGEQARGSMVPDVLVREFHDVLVSFNGG
jgi:hypothetical protein